MTREVDAAVIIDTATYGALGALCDDFRRVEQVTIRGRSERVDVFTLGAPERRRRAA
jgi:class 3 adenylate cyclase